MENLEMGGVEPVKEEKKGKITELLKRIEKIKEDENLMIEWMQAVGGFKSKLGGQAKKDSEEYDKFVKEYYPTEIYHKMFGSGLDNYIDPSDEFLDKIKVFLDEFEGKNSLIEE